MYFKMRVFTVGRWFYWTGCSAGVGLRYRMLEPWRLCVRNLKKVFDIVDMLQARTRRLKTHLVIYLFNRLLVHLSRPSPPFSSSYLGNDLFENASVMDDSAFHQLTHQLHGGLFYHINKFQAPQ